MATRNRVAFFFGAALAALVVLVFLRSCDMSPPPRPVDAGGLLN